MSLSLTSSASRLSSSVAASSSPRGHASVKEITVADRNESTNVISGKRSLSRQDKRNKEATSSLTIIGIASYAGEEMCTDDLVDIGSVIIDDDIYIVQIHCDDDNSVEDNEGEDSGDGVIYRHDLNEVDGGATVSSGES